MTDETKTAAVVTYRPKEPVGSRKTAKHLLETRDYDGVLPDHITPERMVKVALLAINKVPKLLKCTQESLIKAVMDSAELGLDCSGTLGEAWLIPYGRDCVLVVGYRGLLRLARNSGEIARIEAEVVYENDLFEYEKGVNFHLRYRPNLAGRGKAIGAYALMEFKDGAFQAEYMTLEEIERIQKMSKAAHSGPWKEHWSEMARKTVWRRLAKWAPLSSEKIKRAIEISDSEFVVSPDSDGTSGTAQDLNKALGLVADEADEATIVKEFEDEPEEELTQQEIDALMNDTWDDEDAEDEQFEDEDEVPQPEPKPLRKVELDSREDERSYDDVKKAPVHKLDGDQPEVREYTDNQVLAAFGKRGIDSPELLAKFCRHVFGGAVDPQRDILKVKSKRARLLDVVRWLSEELEGSWRPLLDYVEEERLLIGKQAQIKEVVSRLKELG